MSADLTPESLASNISILDGAIGTELIRRGCVREASLELYALDHPQDLRDIHEQYVRAGAQLIYTCTMGANAPNLRKYGAASRVREINARLTELARDTVEDRVMIAGSIGPISAYARDELSATELSPLYAEQMTGIMDGSADLLVLETMTNLTDARAALHTAQELSYPAMITFSPDPDGKLRDGVTVEQAVDQLAGYQPLAVGCNCSPGIDAMTDILARLSKATDLPIIAKPSAGTPVADGNHLTYPLSVDDFAAGCMNLRRSGAVMIGGCCGTDPEYVKAAARQIRTNRPES